HSSSAGRANRGAAPPAGAAPRPPQEAAGEATPRVGAVLPGWKLATCRPVEKMGGPTAGPRRRASCSVTGPAGGAALAWETGPRKALLANPEVGYAKVLPDGRDP